MSAEGVIRRRWSVETARRNRPSPTLCTRRGGGRSEGEQRARRRVHGVSRCRVAPGRALASTHPRHGRNRSRRRRHHRAPLRGQFRVLFDRSRGAEAVGAGRRSGLDREGTTRAIAAGPRPLGHREPSGQRPRCVPGQGPLMLTRLRPRRGSGCEPHIGASRLAPTAQAPRAPPAICPD